MSQIITIKKIDNGFLIESKYPEVDVEIHAITVDNISDNEIEKFKVNDEDKICIARLLDKINDLIGVSYDKFGKENLNITFDKKGHKVE